MSDMKLIMENWKRYTHQDPINESLWNTIKAWVQLGAADGLALATDQNPEFVAGQIIDPKNMGELKGKDLVDLLLTARRGYKEQQAADESQNIMYDMAGPAPPHHLVNYIDLLVRAARIEPDKTYTELFPELVLDRYSRRAGQEADAAAQQDLLKKSEDLIKQITGWLMIAATAGTQVVMEEQTKRDK